MLFYLQSGKRASGKGTLLGVDTPAVVVVGVRKRARERNRGGTAARENPGKTINRTL